MTAPEADWEERVAALWATLDDHNPDDFLAQVQDLTAERPPGDPIALFELACANDSTGHPEQAAPLYREALAAGLPGRRRRRAVIQQASTLRNLGRFSESIELLNAERGRPADELDDAVAAFLALALTDAGRTREAVGEALGALAPHLARYDRSIASYAKDLRTDGGAPHGGPAVTHLFTGLGVRDLEEARAYYERLLGRPPDLVPNEQEAAWKLTGAGWLYIDAGAGTAGGSVLTILVEDLDAHVAALARRGVHPDRTDVLAGHGRKALFTDPDGNRITFAHPGG
jgi:tetratricopeptide (TPR) repeat protein